MSQENFPIKSLIELTKLVVCMPLSWTHVHADFFFSWDRMWAPETYSNLQKIGVGNCMKIFSNATPLDHCRNKLVRAALDQGADLILWLDADQTFPPDLPVALVRGLLAAPADVGVYGGIYFKITPPHDLVTSKFVTATGLALKHVDLNPENVLDVFEVDVTGMGATLFRRSVFEQVSYPWFRYAGADRPEGPSSEEVPLFRDLKDRGIKVLVDRTLVCGHLRVQEIRGPECG